MLQKQIHINNDLYNLLAVSSFPFPILNLSVNFLINPPLEFDLDAYRGSTTVASVTWAMEVDMDSNATLRVDITVFDNSQDVDISGGSDAQTYTSFKMLS